MNVTDFFSTWREGANQGKNVPPVPTRNEICKAPHKNGFSGGFFPEPKKNPQTVPANSDLIPRGGDTGDKWGHIDFKEENTGDNVGTHWGQVGTFLDQVQSLAGQLGQDATPLVLASTITRMPAQWSGDAITPANNGGVGPGVNRQDSPLAGNTDLKQDTTPANDPGHVPVDMAAVRASHLFRARVQAFMAVHGGDMADAEQVVLDRLQAEGVDLSAIPLEPPVADFTLAGKSFCPTCHRTNTPTIPPLTGRPTRQWMLAFMSATGDCPICRAYVVAFLPRPPGFTTRQWRQVCDEIEHGLVDGGMLI